MSSQLESREMSDIRHKLDDSVWSPFECYLFDSDKEVLPVPLHWHYFAEVILVKEGVLKAQRGDKTCLVNAGELLLIPSLMPHQLDYGKGNETVRYEMIRMDMEQLGELPSYAPDLRSALLAAEKARFSMHFSAADVRKYHLDQMVDRCVLEYSARTYGYDLIIRSILYLLTTVMVRIWMREGFIPQGPVAQIEPIYTIPSYIAHHIHEPLKVEDLARRCGLSYPWFARKFHDIYGITCKDYIEKVRIRKVEQYLTFTDCDLNYISEHSGYADCSHLIRDFRKFHNTTPVRFRASHQQMARIAAQFP